MALNLSQVYSPLRDAAVSTLDRVLLSGSVLAADLPACPQHHLVSTSHFLNRLYYNEESIVGLRLYSLPVWGAVCTKSNQTNAT